MPTPTAATPPSDVRAVVNRLRRAQGQLDGVLRMVEDGREVTAVVQQIKAVGGALDRAGFALVALELRRWLVAGEDVDDERLAAIEAMVVSLG